MNDSLILSFYKNQRHFSQDTHVISAPYSNMSCGDEIVLHVNDKGKLVYSGSACSLTFASAEFLCREVEAQDAGTVDIRALQKKMFEEFEMSEEDKRATCVLLPFRALAVMQSELRKV
ncbi:hypothetical protein IT418_01170 [bacterium]|nr:hypothetical protein [bacterium]